MTGMLLTACAVTRDSATYCETVATHKDRYLNSMSQAAEGSLGDLLTGLSAIGDLKNMWVALAEVAPEEIRIDTEAVRDAWIAQEKAAANGDVGGALISGLLNSGSMSRVDSYIRDNCDIDSSNASPETPTSELAEPTVHLDPGGGWDVLGDLLVKGGYTQGQSLASRGPVSVFGVEFGEVAIDAVTLFPVEDIRSQSWTVAGKMGRQYVVGLVETRVAAKGLDPEEFVMSLVTLDLDSGVTSIRGQHEIASSACDVAYGPLVGSYGDVIALEQFFPSSSGECNQQVFVYGYDALTGKRVWEKDAWLASLVYEAITVANSVPTGRYGAACITYRGVDVATGRDTWVFDAGKQAVIDGYCGSTGIVDYVGNGAAYSRRSQHDYSVHVSVAHAREMSRDFDARTGAQITVIQPFQYFDPLTKYGLMYGQSFGSGREDGLIVYDTVSGKTIYEIDVERMTSLDARAEALFGGRLFLTTSDQHLEIDAKSGDIVSESNSAYPIALVGEYAYFSNGKLVPISQVNDYRPAF